MVSLLANHNVIIVTTCLLFKSIIQGMSDMKSSPLSSIDENLIDACSFLEDFRDDTKLDCLQTFVNCADIIEWIRTYTKGNVSS